MEKRDILAIFLFAGIVITGYMLFYDNSNNNAVEGYAIYTEGLFNLNFVFPTPSNGAYINTSSVIINVTGDANLSSVWIEWNYANESMALAGNSWSITKTGSGNFTFKAYANDSYDNVTYTSLRTITLNFTNTSSGVTGENLSAVSLNFTTINNITAAEDSSASLAVDLASYTQTNKNASLLNYTLISQSNSSVISCALGLNRYVNCSFISNQSGLNLISVRVNYSTVYASTAFLITVTPVNDAPYVTGIIPNITMRNNQNATILLSTYFADVDNATLAYNCSAVLNITMGIVSSNASFYPNAGFVGERIMNCSASDGASIAASNNFILNITSSTNNTNTTGVTVATLNVSQAAVNKIESISWNDSTPEYVLNLGSYFVNIGDNPVYTISGLSNIAYSIVADKVIFRAEKGWHGTETAIISVTSSKGEFSSEPFTLAVAAANSAPVVKKQIPEIVFNSTNKETSINLDDYFSDPNIEELDYSVDRDAGVVNITHGNKNWIVFSPASGAKGAINSTVKITAKDKEGASVSQNVNVAILSDFYSGWGIGINGLAVMGLVAFIIIASLVYRKLGVQIPVGIVGRNKQFRPQRISAPKEDENLIVNKPVMPTTNNNFVGTGLGWMKDVFSRKEVNPVLKAELFAVRESLANVRALKDSSDDGLIKAALQKGEDKLVKTLHGLMINKDVKNTQREMIYLREVYSSLKEIREMCFDKTVKQELRGTMDNLYGAINELQNKREIAVNPLYNMEDNRN